MNQIGSLQPQTYWDGLREHEEALFQRTNSLTPVMYPDAHAAATWNTGNNDLVSPDAVAYNARSRFFGRGRDITLTEFSLRDRGNSGFARVYYLDLRPGREMLTVVSFFTRLRHIGLDPSDKKARKTQIDLAKELGQLIPGREHYEFIKEQFARGASDIFTYRDPATDP